MTEMELLRPCTRASFVVLSCLLLLSACQLRTQKTQRNTAESAIVWAQTSNQCLAWLVTPASTTIFTDTLPYDNCHLVFEPVNQAESLLQVQEVPGKIIIYDIVADGPLSKAATLELDDIEIVSRPQLSPNGQIYFAGIQHGRQQLFAVNRADGVVEMLNRKLGGAPIRPLLSPGGRYLAFEVDPHNDSEEQCRPYCGGLYHVFDIVTGHEWVLANETLEPASEHPCMHNWLEWSPTGERVAILEFCSSTEAIRIFDVITQQPLGVIIDDTSLGLTIDGWLNDAYLLYNRVVFTSIPGISSSGESSLVDIPVRKHFIYSLTDAKSQPLASLPLIDSNGQPFMLQNVDWTEQGNRFAGVVATGQDNEHDLIVFEMNDERSVINLTQYIDTNPTGGPAFGFRRPADPAWSESGQWLAFSEAESQAGFAKTIQFIELIGNRRFSLELPEGVVQYEFVWLKR